MQIELDVPFLLHHRDNLLCPILLLLGLLKEYLIKSFSSLGIRLDKLNRLVSGRGSIHHFGDKRHAISELGIALLFRRHTSVERLNHRDDIRGEAGRRLDQIALIGAKHDELKCNRHPTLQPVLKPKHGFDGVVEVDRAGLQLRAYGVINSARHAVFNLMTKLKKEHQVCLHTSVDGTVRRTHALRKIPILLRAARR